MGSLTEGDKNTLRILSEYKLDADLFRTFREKHGSDDAQAAKRLLEPAVRLYARVAPEYINSLPEQCANEFMTPARALLELLEELRLAKFDIDRSATFINKVDRFNKQQFQVAMQAAIASSLFSGEIDRMLTTAKSEREATIELVDSLKKNITDFTIHERAGHFAKEAKNSGWLAFSWLVATGLSCAAVFEFALRSYAHEWPFNITEGIRESLASGSNVLLVQLALSKLLIFGVLSYFVVFCARNYTASKHNATVNRHRALSLLTYQSLADAAKQTDVILSHAASAIYAHQPTGYTSSKHDDGPTAKAFVDLVTQTTKGGDT
ncbi:MAG: hypothetical protein CMJ46_01685 [Planctomyces sp.]|nr:hypothetical protein [Planctomyces sp.]